VLNHTLQNQIPTTQIYDAFLGASSAIEEEVIEEKPMKKFVKKTYPV